MLFNSYLFIFVFFPLVLLGYYGLQHFGQKRLAVGFLVMMSMWFYGNDNIKYLFILMISIILNYLIVEGMDRLGKQTARFCLFLTGLAVNLGILFYFKYYDFFIENVNSALKTDFALLHLMLPLGISFYTFQQLSYVIDSYRRDSEKYGLLEYAAYVSFFPQLIAGPIVYHDELIPQLRREQNHHFRFENASRGIYAFALGLAKKVLIADTFSKVVIIGYDNIGELNTISVLVVMVCYSLQIYFDFSGYCDMAYGIGYLFNVKLPVNFNSPYKAVSIVEFWDRWHMTLTRFFTKYIYIPLGGSRRGKVRTYINVMFVFLVSGIWHGANWTFILWGVINGIGNVLTKLLGRFFRWVPRTVGVIVTFCFTTFAWSLFRADSIRQARQLWGQLGNFGDGTIYAPITETVNDLIEVKIISRLAGGSIMESCPWLPLTAFMVLVLLACFFLKNTQEKAADNSYGNKRIVWTVVLMLWSILSLSDVSEFLYFNF